MPLADSVTSRSLERRQERVDIRKLVPLGTLNDVVQYENSPVVSRLKDQHILVLGFLVVQDLFDLERHGLARPHVGDLAEPAIWKVYRVSRVLNEIN